MGDDPAAHDRPHLRLVRGDASPEEVAAVLAVLAARAAGAAAAGGTAPERPASAWADPGLAMRRYTYPASGAWQRSGTMPGVRTRADW